MREEETPELPAADGEGLDQGVVNGAVVGVHAPLKLLCTSAHLIEVVPQGLRLRHEITVGPGSHLDLLQSCLILTTASSRYRFTRPQKPLFSSVSRRTSSVPIGGNSGKGRRIRGGGSSSDT